MRKSAEWFRANIDVMRKSLQLMGKEIEQSALTGDEYVAIGDKLSLLYHELSSRVADYTEQYPITTLSRIIGSAEKSFGYTATKQAIGILYPDAEDYDHVYLTETSAREFIDTIIKEGENV